MCSEKQWKPMWHTEHRYNMLRLTELKRTLVLAFLNSGKGQPQKAGSRITSRLPTWSLNCATQSEQATTMSQNVLCLTWIMFQKSQPDIHCCQASLGASRSQMKTTRVIKTLTTLHPKLPDHLIQGFRINFKQHQKWEGTIWGSKEWQWLLLPCVLESTWQL